MWTKEYKTLLAESSVSIFGDAFFYICFVAYLSSFPKADVLISIWTVINQLPNFIRIFSGVYADKINNKYRAIMVCNIVRFVCFLSVAGLILLNKDNLIYFIIFIVFLSEIVGTVARKTILPFFKYSVPKNELQVAQGINNGSAQAIQIIGAGIGSSLIGFISLFYISLLNALTFAIAWFIFINIKKRLVQIQAAKIIVQTNKSINFFKKIPQAYMYLKSNYKRFLVVHMSLLNGVSNAFVAMFLVLLTQNKSLEIINYQFTAASIYISFMLGNVLGSVALVRKFKNMPIIFLLKLCEFLSILLLLVVLLSQTIIVIIILFFYGVLGGIVSAKIFAEFILNVPTKLVSSFMGLVETISLSLAPILTFIFNSLAIIYHGNTSIISLLILSTITLLYTILFSGKYA
ncbi:MAG: MFS transporter [Bifidobacteriaceae bacterium]|jgi:MFS family permease|nr:MFS transporter [Bifidobacteriaceae bacterium]